MKNLFYFIKTVKLNTYENDQQLYDPDLDINHVAL